MKWQPTIKEYQLFLKIERGLSFNTIESYSRDINKLLMYLEANKINKTPISIDVEILQQFIYEIAKQVAATSQSRIISGLRNFFDYLVFEGYRADNPTDLIETPKTGRKLPDTLSEDEIDQLIMPLTSVTHKEKEIEQFLKPFIAVVYELVKSSTYSCLIYFLTKVLLRF